MTNPVTIAAVKAIRIHEDGGPEVLRYEEAPGPVPGPARSSCISARPRSITSTSGSARAFPRSPSRASSARTAPAPSITESAW